jgi:hypothetical protein
MTTRNLSIQVEEIVDSGAIGRLLTPINPMREAAVEKGALRSRQWFIHKPARLLRMDAVFEAFARVVSAAADPAPITFLLTAATPDTGLSGVQRLAARRRLRARAVVWAPGAVEVETEEVGSGRPAVTGTVDRSVLASVLRQQYEHPSTTLVVVESGRNSADWLSHVLTKQSEANAIDISALVSELRRGAELLVTHSGAWDIPSGFAVNLVGTADRLDQIADPPAVVVLDTSDAD